MSRKENEAVVNRFLLSSLYFIIGLCGVYFLYKLAQNPRVILNFGVIVWTLLGLFVVFSGICFFKKSKYYGILFAVLAVCMVIISVYFPVFMANLYPFFQAKGLSVFLNSYMPYVMSGGLMAVAYIYEVIHYFLNANK